jgi:hypothetical protein
METSDSIESAILNAIQEYDGSFELSDSISENSFETLISMGELVDRLSIVNFKLYKLKDEVMNRPDDQDFRAWASVEDVRLVEERARLKKCIDVKTIGMFRKYQSGDQEAGFNPEVKKYGDG